MKTAPLVFLAAVGLLVVAIAVPQRVEPPLQTLALDGDGIVALRVEGEVRSEVDYSPDDCDCDETPDAHAAGHSADPQVSWPSDGDGRVEVRREGDTLVLEVSGFDGERFGPAAAIQIRPPAGVRRIELHEGVVQSNRPLPPMTVHTRGDLRWYADAASLALVQTPTPECLAEEYCLVSVEIRGTIGDLSVEAGHADVDLQAPHLVGRALVRLAPLSELSLSDARRVGHVAVEYVDFDGRPLSPAEADAARAKALADEDGVTPGDAGAPTVEDVRGARR